MYGNVIRANQQQEQEASNTDSEQEVGFEKGTANGTTEKYDPISVGLVKTIMYSMPSLR
jgi:hypothetical protein